MNSNDSNLLDEVKDTLNAITALKNGKPTAKPEKEAEESTEEVMKDETVEETKDAKEEVEPETAEEVVEEVTEEESEEAEEESEEVKESTKDDETTEDETEKAAKEETVTKFANANDVNEILNAVKELTSYVTTLSGDVEALKNAKTSRKGVMPETEVEEDQNDEETKIKKEVDYIFGK